MISCWGPESSPYLFLWFHLRKLRTRFRTDPSGIALTLICLATVLTVDLSGLLRGETAGCGCFFNHW
jgi:hypothetical protein